MLFRLYKILLNKMLLKLSFHLSVYIYTENICIFLLCGLHLWHTLSFCWAVHHHSKGLGMTISKLTFLISLSAPKHSCQILEWACCFGWPSEHSCFTRQNSLLVLWGASLPSHRLRVACCTQVTPAGLVFMLSILPLAHSDCSPSGTGPKLGERRQPQEFFWNYW